LSYGFPSAPPHQNLWCGGLPTPARSPSLCSGNSGREAAGNGGQVSFSAQGAALAKFGGQGSALG